VHVSRTIRILADFKLPIAPYLKYSFAIFLFLLYRSYCSLSSAFVFAVGTMIRSAPFLAQVRMLSGTILPVHHYPYLLEADPEEAVSIKADENSGVAWFSPEEALEKSTEPWFVEHVYSKLLEKMNDVKGNGK
jgi:hypothetical protein